MSLKSSVERYKELLEKGENLQLIDVFYDEAITQIENDASPLKGKATLRALEEKNLEKTDWLQTRITSLVLDEAQGLVLGEMEIVFQSKQSGRRKINEAFVQKWDKGKIIYQRFYYGGIQEA